MSDASAALTGVDLTVPNVARMYDYYLGGDNNFAADRAAAAQVLSSFPMVAYGAHANRGFLRRAVTYMAARGVTQFLDVGTGLPTQGQVHQVVPHARVVYVDNDPIVTVHARALLDDPERVTIVEGDLREPATIIDHPKTAAFIDWDRPVGLLMLAVLHFIPDDQGPHAALAAFRDRMAPGSMLALSHATWDGLDDSQASDRDAATALYRRSSASSAVRTRAQVAALLEGFEIVPSRRSGRGPRDLVWISQWRNPDLDPFPERSMGYAAVATVRAAG